MIDFILELSVTLKTPLISINVPLGAIDDGKNVGAMENIIGVDDVE